MPIPKPKAEETEQEYISRCMSDDKLQQEYADDQRYAICKLTWNRAEQKFQDSYNDYPDTVRNNARRGIELNEKQGRAQQLANGEKVSMETIKRMYSYLSRAEVYYDQGDPEDCGYISYLLWGGKAAKDWAESKIK
jgi:hypothetical protein